MNNIGNGPEHGEENFKHKSVLFDEAIALTGIGRYHHLLFVGSGFCLVSLICVSLNASYLVVPAQCEFHMTSQDKGLLTSILFLGMIASSHLWGFLADTQGRKKILIFTVCCDVVFTVISCFAHTFEFFLFCRFMNGVFICGPSAVVYAYLGEFHSNATRTRVIMWAGCFIGAGTTLLPALAWLIIPQEIAVPMPWHTTLTSWRIFVLVCAIPSSITAFILITFLKESPKFLVARGKTQQALKVLRYVYSMNTGKPPETYPVHHLEMDPSENVVQFDENTQEKIAFSKVMYNQTAPLLKMPYVFKTILACLIQFGLYTSCNGFLLWLPEIFNRQAEFTALYPNATATVCQMVTDLVAPVSNGKAYLYSLVDGDQVQVNVTNDNGHTYSLLDQGNSSALNCVPNVDPSAFQNTLIIGAGCAVAYIIIGFIIGFIPKKLVLVCCMTSSAAAGLGMVFVSTSTGITVLSSLFVVLSGVCISLVNSIVIDAFPTHLRAMAVCISLMFGRLGTVVGALLLGALLDIDCTTVFYVLSGIVLSCGVLSAFYPTPKKEKLIDIIT